MKNMGISAAVVFQTGFRCFFLGAAGFALFSGLLWVSSMSLGTPHFGHTSPLAWHAHEMIYGYALAVIFGFLLTAVTNWTGMNTLNGLPLFFVFSLWVVCRIALLLPTYFPVQSIAILETLLLMLVILRISAPIIRKRQINNYGIIGLMVMMLLSNLLFYSGMTLYYPNGLNYGLYLGFYTVLAFVMVMSRRVIPFFIEKGVGYPVKVKNWLWADVSSLVFLGAYAFSDVFYPQPTLLFGCALGLVALHTLRAWGWYTHGIWNKPLLWVLCLGYVCMIIGFALKMLEFIYPMSPFLALHALAVGGIGLITIGMMSRIAIGHTGRNVIDAPPTLFWIFTLGIGAFFTRVVLPLLIPSLHFELVSASQIIWVIAFAVFLFVYIPILLKPRVDGQPG